MATAAIADLAEPELEELEAELATLAARLYAGNAAFARGELSYAKVRALTRVATEENEAELLELACLLTAAQLERAVSAYRPLSTAEARDLQEDAFLSVYWEGDGSLGIRGRLAPEDGALLLRALEPMRDQLWQAGRGSAEPRPARQASRAEAASSRTTEAQSARSRTEARSRRRLFAGLACDASLVRNGRRTRTMPPVLRRALRARDGGCRFPATSA